MISKEQEIFNLIFFPSNNTQKIEKETKKEIENNPYFKFYRKLKLELQSEVETESRLKLSERIPDYNFHRDNKLTLTKRFSNKTHQFYP